MVSMLSHGITNFSRIVAMRYTSGADAMAVTTVTYPASVGAPDEDAKLALTGHLHWRNLQVQFRNYDTIILGKTIKKDVKRYSHSIVLDCAESHHWSGRADLVWIGRSVARCSELGRAAGLVTARRCPG